MGIRIMIRIFFLERRFTSYTLYSIAKKKAGQETKDSREAGREGRRRNRGKGGQDRKGFRTQDMMERYRKGGKESG